MNNKRKGWKLITWGITTGEEEEEEESSTSSVCLSI